MLNRPVDGLNIKTFKEELESELKNNIIKFWVEHSIDRENGGFYGEISNDLKINEDAGKGLILNTRILWTFSAAKRLLKKDKYGSLATRAFQYITKYFWDNIYGGGYWLLDKRGFPVNTRKQIYGQAFMIYAFSEYYRATRENEALEKAIETFRLIEKHSADPVCGGYIEARKRDWKATDELKLSSRDQNTKKSMNTHLHLLEAYTNLYRVWPELQLKERLEGLLEVIVEHILDKDSYHFKLFFDKKWNSQLDGISYGHDIEGSWLLYEAAALLNNDVNIEQIRNISIKMAEAVQKEAVGNEGGIIYEADTLGNLDEDRHWWPQAEALVGFINAYQLTGKGHFLKEAYDIWKYIYRHLIDRDYGEWYWKVSKEGGAAKEFSKVNTWKTPYHNSRACFEAIKRLNEISREMKGNESALTGAGTLDTAKSFPD